MVTSVPACGNRLTHIFVVQSLSLLFGIHREQLGISGEIESALLACGLWWSGFEIQVSSGEYIVVLFFTVVYHETPVGGG